MGSICCSTLALAVPNRETSETISRLVHPLESDESSVVNHDVRFIHGMTAFNQLERLCKSFSCVHTTSLQLLLSLHA